MPRSRIYVACFHGLAILVPLTSGASCTLAFERFEFRSLPGRGFCAPLGAVFSADVVRDATGAYVASVSILDLAPSAAAGESCVGRGVEADGICARARWLAPRVLAGAEVERLEMRLEEVVAHLQAPPGLDWRAPCLQRTLSLDGLYAAESPLAQQVLFGGALDELLRAVEELRPALTSAENGDTNGDGARDLSDALFLLQHLFLGGRPPAEARCTDDSHCSTIFRYLLVLSSGDTNADWTSDLADAVRLLEWLFRDGEEPAALCDCLGGRICEPGACAPGDVCIPFIEGSICTSQLMTCDEVRGIYGSLIHLEASCRPEVGCHVLNGHCWIGLGGCYHAVPRTIRQEHLDALAERFLDLGGLETCAESFCVCPPPPQGVECLGGGCRLVE